jgi:hypothetical protein
LKGPPCSSITAPGNPDLCQSTLIPLTSSDNISCLVQIRRRHQTKEAEKGVRRHGLSPSEGQSESRNSDPSCVSGEPVSDRQLLARKIRDIVKEVDGTEDIGTSAGLNRQIRWTKTPGLYSPSLTQSNSLTDGKRGNSANALEVAQKAANTVRFVEMTWTTHADSLRANTRRLHLRRICTRGACHLNRFLSRSRSPWAHSRDSL